MNATHDPWGGLTPRAWQAAALPVIMGELVKGGGPMVRACTGAGKSVLQRAIVSSVLARPRPGVVVVDVPSQALVRQLAATLEAHPLLSGRVGQFYGQKKVLHEDGVIVVCRASLGPLAERIEAEGWQVRLYMADEAHSQPGRQVYFNDVCQPARRIGVTATPYRSDIEDSLALWDRIVVNYQISDALRDGVLVPFDVITGQGDGLSVDDNCVRLMRDYAEGGRMIANALDIDDAERFADLLTGSGVHALAVHSKLSITERDRRRDMLRDGEIAALVHVATLVEGVDWPWLRVLCLRRQAVQRAIDEMMHDADDPTSAGGSRVRLVQEAGRVLRAYPGKDRAVIIDPMGVCALVGLTHEAAIGGDMIEAPDAERNPDAEPMAKGEYFSPKMRARSQVFAWLAQANQFAVMAGTAEASRPGKWRAKPVSEKQLDVLRAKTGAYMCLPDTVRRVMQAAVREMAERPDLVTKGAASDALSLIFAGAKRGKVYREEWGRWPDGDAWWGAIIPPIPPNLSDLFGGEDE